MARIEARQFAVGDQVQTGQFLCLEDDHHGVTQDKARRIAYEPGWNRITSDDRCLDAFTHFAPARIMVLTLFCCLITPEKCIGRVCRATDAVSRFDFKSAISDLKLSQDCGCAAPGAP